MKVLLESAHCLYSEELVKLTTDLKVANEVLQGRELLTKMIID